jgi:hypothetical protein
MGASHSEQFLLPASDLAELKWQGFTDAERNKLDVWLCERCGSLSTLLRAARGGIRTATVLAARSHLVEFWNLLTPAPQTALFGVVARWMDCFDSNGQDPEAAAETLRDEIDTALLKMTTECEVARVPFPDFYKTAHLTERKLMEASSEVVLQEFVVPYLNLCCLDESDTVPVLGPFGHKHKLIHSLGRRNARRTEALAWCRKFFLVPSRTYNSVGEGQVLLLRFKADADTMKVKNEWRKELGVDMTANISSTLAGCTENQHAVHPARTLINRAHGNRLLSCTAYLNEPCLTKATFLYLVLGYVSRGFLPKSGSWVCGGADRADICSTATWEPASGGEEQASPPVVPERVPEQNEQPV